MKKYLKIILSLLLLAITLMACKEYKHTSCDSCGKISNNCYKVTYVNHQLKSEYSYYVCSEQCENVITSICLFSGYVKK